MTELHSSTLPPIKMFEINFESKIFALFALSGFCLGEIGKMRKTQMGFSSGKKDVNLTSAIRDIVLGLPTTHVTLLFDNFLGNLSNEYNVFLKHFQSSPYTLTAADARLLELLTKKLHGAGLTTSIYAIDNKSSQEKFCKYTKESLTKYEDLTNVIFSSRDTAVDLFWMVQQEDLLHRKLLYMFYWGQQPIESGFSTDHFEAMRIAVISSPRPGTYRVYYSQAQASGTNGLTLVNWWSSEGGLFGYPVLPSPVKVYQNFKGRVFDVPVLHKPPWHFVEYINDSFKADGGRDDKLLAVIAEKLNFRYRYVDPPERLQGSGINENGTFPGVLGQVWQREVDFFMGDVTITYERSKAVEFSFLTLVDSEAFVTHRPSRLNEALALVRPFQWQVRSVWPPIIGTFALFGPILFAIIEAPYIWKKEKRSSKKRKKLLCDCIWLSTTTFLRQGGSQPESNHKVRLVLILVTLGATYVIGDMYSANLTSLLARPGREKPITLLNQLEVAMNTRGYELLVEKHSSSFSTLQNGTGIYERLWKKMQKQNQYFIESVELGMKLVRKKTNVAVLGGRETLYFDTKRFGSHNFHLSEKLNTRYSAIAMQLGCPYIENFNRILMQLFEGGILTKMTEEEYERLGEKQRAAAGMGETDEQIAEAKEEVQKRGEASEPQSNIEKLEEVESLHQMLVLNGRHQLQPLNTRMLQGAFYILIIGYLLSGVILTFEMFADKLQMKFHCKKLSNTWCKGVLSKQIRKLRSHLILLWSNLTGHRLNRFSQVEDDLIQQKSARGAFHKNEAKFIL